MYTKPTEIVEKYRIRGGPMGSDAGYGNNGVFICPSPFRSTLKVIASDELGWEHVSVSVYRQKRTPTWDEMCWVKDLFWAEDECVIQYHPPREAKRLARDWGKALPDDVARYVAGEFP